MANTQNKRQSQRRRKKKKSADNYLYIAIGFLLLGIILIGAIICVAVGCDNGEESSIPPSESSIASESSIVVEESRIDDSQVIAGWVEADGNKYYYDADGNKYTGLNEIDGSIYVFEDDGCMLSGGWVTVSNNKYYLNSDGTAYIGWLELEGKTYYLQADGSAAVGETEIDGERHFFSSAGAEFAVANPWNSVPDDEADLVTLPAAYGHETKGKVDKSCYDDLMQMMDDCYRQTGKDVYVISGHRTYEYQQGNFQRQVNLFLNQGYSTEEAERLAAEWVAVPGTSEHHLGLAVDIIDTEIWDLVEEQEDLEGQQWLMANSWKYGFILRYPKDGKAETGINYEPWHYRYLGKELAKEVYDSGLTLEAYIKSLG